MNLSRRSALFLLLLGISLLVVFIFHSFLLASVVSPVALVVWLIGRALRTVDQQVYWYVLIAAAVIYAFVRLSRELTDLPPAAPPESNFTLEAIKHWRVLIPLTTQATGKPDVLKQTLWKMLTAIYTSKQSESVHWEIDEALRLRRIPLPESIYTFLFPNELPEHSHPRDRTRKSILQTPRMLVRRWTGREAADYYRSIEEVLAFMESLVEKKHDEKSRTRNH
jgi:hypothetical protein